MSTQNVPIDIREGEGDPHRFFRCTPGVTSLDSDPWDRQWTALVDDETVGMLVAEEFSTPHLVRLAVRKEWRRQGVATALINAVMSEYDQCYAYVDEDNVASQQLLASLGFEKGGYAPPPNLERWSVTTSRMYK